MRIVAYWNVDEVKQNNTLMHLPRLLPENTEGNQSSIRMSQARLFNYHGNSQIGNFYTTEHNFLMPNSDYNINRNLTFKFKDECFNVPNTYIKTDFFSSSPSLLLGNGTYRLKPTVVGGFFEDKEKIRIKIKATDTNRIKLYVNGAQVTAFATSNYPTQN